MSLALKITPLKLICAILILSSLILQQALSKRNCLKKESDEDTNNGEGQKERVTGVSDAREGQFPSHFIYRFKQEETGEWAYCGAFLMNNRQLLTAGECIASTRNGTGEVLISGIKRDYDNAITVKVEKTCVNPDLHYEISGVFKEDWGVLNVAEPIKFTDNIKPAQLCYKCEISDDSELLAVGFGLMNDSQATSTKALQYLPMLRTPCPTKHRLPESMFCAKPKTTGITCLGDTGGAVYMMAKGNQTVVGLTSGPTIRKKCHDGYYGFSFVTKLYNRENQVTDLLKSCEWIR